MTPTMLWTDMRTTAGGHCSEVARPPYPMVCWVSREKRKLEVKLLTLSTQST